MENYAELEIGLYPYKDDEYTLGHRFSLPQGVVDLRLGQDRPARVKLVSMQLRLQSPTPQEYAQSLTDSFFEDQQVRIIFDEARKLAGSNGVPLRVRLFISPGTPDLHSIYWEELLDPEAGTPLFTGENILFSRYLESSDTRPVRLAPKEKFSALVFVANPTDLASYQNLAPIDVQGEFQRARDGLGDSVTTLFRDNPATLENLAQALRDQKPDILYLVCHGAMHRDEPYLWLEDQQGNVKITPGKELVARFKELGEQPLVVVLASCESAGPESAGDARAALGPLLAESGVPAVVAMQGSISIPTVDQFMPVFFGELRKDGQLDRAISLARGQVREHYDYWMPVLFTRLKNGSIFAEDVLAAPRPNWRLRAVAGGMTLLILAILGFGAWSYIRDKPMGPGFNIAVAKFGEQDAQGQLHATERSVAVSRGLYSTIQNTLKQLPPAYQYDSRGPDTVGIVPGTPGQDCNAQATKLAEKWNANMLVYGVVRRAQNGYEVMLSFCVIDDIQYGGEITGPNRLGQPVPVDFELSQDPLKLVELNTRLNDRVGAMQHIVKGLASFYFGDYDEAALEFQKAINLPFWEKESETKAEAVVYVLWGSTKLRAYDGFNRDQSQVNEARGAFEQAIQLDDTYARAYLGLGSATLVEATRLAGNQQARLYEARDWINTALEKPDQPVYAYVPLKAAYELGQVYLLGFEQGFAGFSKEQSTGYFQQVLDGYQSAGRPAELTWYSAAAWYYLGRLKGWDEDWNGMSGNCSLASEELLQLNSASLYFSRLSARVDFCVGWARWKQNRLGEARTLIQNAIDTGGKYVDPAELDEWQQTLKKVK